MDTYIPLHANELYSERYTDETVCPPPTNLCDRCNLSECGFQSSLCLEAVIVGSIRATTPNFRQKRNHNLFKQGQLTIQEKGDGKWVIVNLKGEILKNSKSLKIDEQCKKSLKKISRNTLMAEAGLSHLPLK